ncbi:uncharacterized protein LOC122937775 isoform X2 [Bufo gargarizans]|uniref:uncharacterized protein LOC122937775 isoform X2 n=1 Tax=Bufo gargarizans TaxID=30331 RepID=UPI001CF5D209|nr:uncharacterized protein LOC122937775 isoform X2 [Bufo gargarizans]
MEPGCLLFSPVEEVKNRSRSCRDPLRKEIVHSRSGSGLPKKRPYMFKEQLMFLCDIMDLRPTENNLEEEVEGTVEHHSSAGEVEGPSSPSATEVGQGTSTRASQATAPPTSEVEASLAGQSRHKRSAQPGDTSVNVQVLEYLNRARHEDTYDLYARSLATHFRNLTPERYFRVQTVISTVLEACTPPNDPSDLFRASDNWQMYGNTSGPVQRSSPPVFPPHQEYPPHHGRHYVPPPPHYGPSYSGEATYRPPGPSASQSVPQPQPGPSAPGS